MTRMIRLICLLMPLIIAAPSVSAQSLTLDEAERLGLVGEQRNGYLGIVSRAPGIDDLVDRVNLQRKQLYRDIATKNGVPLSSVEALAGEKAIREAQPGEYVQGNEGWVRK